MPRASQQCRWNVDLGLAIRTFLCETGLSDGLEWIGAVDWTVLLTRDQLIQRLRRYARKQGLAIQVDRHLGKGSHYRVKLGDRVSTLQSELNPGRIERFLKQLGLTSRDL